MAEIGINLRADPSQFEAGTKAAQKAVADWVTATENGADDVSEKFEEVLRTLVRLGTESGKTRSDMVRDLGKLGLSAEQAEDAIEAVWDEMGKGQQAARDAEKAADSLDGVKDAADGVGSKVTDLGSIAKDVLSGDFGSAAESAIGALAGLGAFAGAGGALAGLLAGGLADMVGGWVGEWGKAAEEVKQRFADAYQSAAEDGRAFLDETQILAMATELYFDPGARKAAGEDAKRLGADLQTVILAQAGDQDALNALIELGNAKIGEGTDRMREKAEAGKNVIDMETAEVATLEALVGKYMQQLGLQQENEAAGRAVLTLQEEMAAKEAANTAQGLAGMAQRYAALEELYTKAANPPAVTIPITPDASAFNAEMERIRRANYSARVGIDVVVNQRRGTQLQ